MYSLARHIVCSFDVVNAASGREDDLGEHPQGDAGEQGGKREVAAVKKSPSTERQTFCVPVARSKEGARCTWNLVPLAADPAVSCCRDFEEGTSYAGTMSSPPPFSLAPLSSHWFPSESDACCGLHQRG